jgi:hypothetical protein
MAISNWRYTRTQRRIGHVLQLTLFIVIKNTL